MKGAQLVRDKVTGQLKPVMTPCVSSSGARFADMLKDKAHSSVDSPEAESGGGKADCRD